MKNTMRLVADLMALAARTAPKAKGDDFVEIRVIDGKDIDMLADDMVKYGEETGKKNFDRDGENVRNSGAVLLLSLNNAETAGLNCGACGFSECSQLELKKGPEFDGAICAWRLIDLGIALGSAVKTAGILNADNRVMYRIGVCARRLNMIVGEMVVGVPISASGKNIYFDRG